MVAPVFVEVQCELCGAFWRFEQGKEPIALMACPECDPALMPDGITFVAGERGEAVSSVACRTCGNRWQIAPKDLLEKRGQMIDWCSFCRNAGRGTMRHWVPWQPRTERTNVMADKTKANGAERIERARYEEMLPCEIQEKDIRAKADALANVIEERDQVKTRRRAAMSAFKEKLSFYDKRIKELGESVRMKTEKRPVTCVEYLVDRQNKVEVVRMDTDEIVSTRAATAEDKQDDLFGAEKPKRGRKKKADSVVLQAQIDASEK